MQLRYIPLWLRHAPAPSVRGFATLAGFEAASRGILISVYPVEVYRVLGDPLLVSETFFGIGLASMAAGLMVPWANRYVRRHWLYLGANLLFVLGALLGATGGAGVILGLLLTTTAIAALFVSFNAYILDYIQRTELGRAETLRLFYSALGWTLGPVAGVFLLTWWAPAPFLIAAVTSACQALAFLHLRLRGGRMIVRVRSAAPSPLGYLSRFLAQPRLVAGYLFALIRSVGWWVYVVYLPIFAVEAGLPPQLGGTMLSATNAALFLSPLMMRWVEARSVRHAVRTGFLGSALLFGAAGLVSGWPALTLVCLAVGAFFLSLLDLTGGLPFLMAVKPSERTEMSAVYASFRDVSGIVTPGAAWLILLAAPVSGIFTATGLALAGAWLLAGRVHPRLGRARGRGPVTRPSASG